MVREVWKRGQAPARYGNSCDRTLPVKEPPVHLPEYLSSTCAPSAPALPGNWTMKVPDAPAARDPSVCGSGDPEAEPSMAAPRVTPLTVFAPEFLTVIMTL